VLPSWGEKIDIDVQRYIASVKAVVMANLNWRFVSQKIELNVFLIRQTASDQRDILGNELRRSDGRELCECWRDWKLLFEPCLEALTLYLLAE
jgi:hypothetical protein